VILVQQYLARWNDLSPEDRTWKTTRAAILAIYVLFYIFWLLTEGIIIDRISVTISVTILMMIACIGRPWRRWVRLGGDLALYALMWFVYERTRGWGDRAGFPLRVQMPIEIDRALFFGTDPNVWMQEQLLDTQRVKWHDVFGSMLYYSHFMVPPMVIAGLWFSGRQRWIRFMRRFATLLFTACIGFVLLPTAPPWMAAGGGRTPDGRLLEDLPALFRGTGRGWRHIGLGGFVNRWDLVRNEDWSNQVAAMPSLHAGFAFLITLYFWKKIPIWYLRWALLVVYPVGMIASLVYFAEHYVIDALVSWAIIGLAFWFWNSVEKRYPIHEEHDRRPFWFERWITRPEPATETPEAADDVEAIGTFDDPTSGRSNTPAGTP
jgi:PAP2 superfamily